MLGVKVVIARYVSDDPQPGLVECWLDDAHGRRWTFIEKTAIVSGELLDARTTYPRVAVIAGNVVERRRELGGREVVRFDTSRPWAVESVEGETCFDVLPSALVELE